VESYQYTAQSKRFSKGGLHVSLLINEDPFESWQDQYKKLVKIPKQLYSMFMPNTQDEFFLFKINLNEYLKRARTRDACMALQRQYGLPIRPNCCLRELLIKIRVIKMKEARDNTWM
jgi:hypothetical protein